MSVCLSCDRKSLRLRVCDGCKAHAIGREFRYATWKEHGPSQNAHVHVRTEVRFEAATRRRYREARYGLRNQQSVQGWRMLGKGWSRGAPGRSDYWQTVWSLYVGHAWGKSIQLVTLRNVLNR